MFGFMEPGTRSVPHIGRAFAFVGSTRGPHVARDTRNDSSRDESRPPHRREVIFRVDPNRERFSETGFGLPEHRWTGHARRMCRRHRSGAGGQRCQCVRLTPCRFRQGSFRQELKVGEVITVPFRKRGNRGLVEHKMHIDCLNMGISVQDSHLPGMSRHPVAIPCKRSGWLPEKLNSAAKTITNPHHLTGRCNLRQPNRLENAGFGGRMSKETKRIRAFALALRSDNIVAIAG